MDYSFSSPEISALAKAMLKVQESLQPCVRDAVNPFHHSKYATLTAVMQSCRQALLTNGILLTQYPVPSETAQSIGLVTKLIHAESGQYQASLAIIPLAKSDPQAMGSAYTYGRRYALTAMLGIVNEDDDGNAASDLAPKRPQKSSARPLLTALLTELGLSDLIPCYRKYLQTMYNCPPDKLSNDQYQEEKSILEKAKTESLALRNLMRTLHQYK